MEARESAVGTLALLHFRALAKKRTPDGRLSLFKFSYINPNYTQSVAASLVVFPGGGQLESLATLITTHIL